MKKVNSFLISILLILSVAILTLTISPASGWAATYYVDAVLGNDATAIPDDINRPFKAINKINTFFRAGTIVPGDYIRFRKGSTPTEQIFRDSDIELSNCSGRSGAPITITYYGDGSYKPVIIATKTLTNHSNTGWTGPDDNNIYYYTTGSNLTQIYEDDIPLRSASDPSCSSGDFYFDSTVTPKKIYYKPAMGDSPANHRIASTWWGRAISAPCNNYITVDGIGFQCEGIYVNSMQNSMSNWIIQDCDFLYKGVSFFHNATNDNYFTDITVQNCHFDYCATASLAFEGGACSGATFLRLNLLNNVIIHNGLMSDGNAWPNPGPDADCVALQNLKDSNIIGNDISGYIATPYTYPVNGGITYYNGAGATGFNPSQNPITNVTNSGGLIQITTNKSHGLHTGDRVAFWGILDANLGTATYGIHTVSRVDDNSFTLDGSAFPSGSTYIPGTGSGQQEPNLPQTGNVFAKNYIHDLTGAVAHAICPSMGTSNNYATDHTLQMYDNIVANLPIGASGLICPGKQAPSKSLVANNTVYGVDSGIRISGGNYVVKNNIIKNVASYCMGYSTGKYDTLAPNDVDYNCYDSPGTNEIFYWYPDPVDKTKTISQWQSVTGWDGHSIVTNSLFTNQSAAFALSLDFQLQSASPCVNAGENVGLTSDFWGNPIPAPPSSVNMGVHQIPAMPPPPPPPPPCTYSASPTG